MATMIPDIDPSLMWLQAGLRARVLKPEEISWYSYNNHGQVILKQEVGALEI